METLDGDRILIDTGWEARCIEDATARRQLDAVYARGGRRLLVGRANLVTEQLAKIGLTPQDLSVVVVTHGGVDRVGGLGVFAKLPVVVSREAREQPTREPAMAWPEREYTIVEGDVALRPGVTLLATPGHAPGHLSARVRLRRTGSVVLAVHAIASPGELDQGLGDGASDQASWKASAEKLVELADKEAALIVYGYGTAAEPERRMAPEYYE
ncbi:MAG TPA: MBL fold metallo-hydrolase [Solirubrobacteraceae bacterium]